MKKLLQISPLIVLLMIGIAIQSCQKDDVTYSCNKEIDLAVKSQLPEVRRMTRAEWIKAGDIDLQKALYNAFTARQRVDLWVEKLNDASRFFSDQADKNHIGSLIEAISDNVSWFDNNYEGDDFEIFMYRWLEVASTGLSWDKEKLLALVYTPADVIPTKSGSLALVMSNNEINTRTETDPGGYGNTCDCGDDSWQFPACSPLSGYFCIVDHTNPCVQLAHGCGLLWADGCYGKCKRSY